MVASDSEMPDGASKVPQEQEAKPEVTNPKNLAPVDPNESRADREDIKQAIFETRLRRWALVGFVLAAVLYFLWQGLR